MSKFIYLCIVVLLFALPFFFLQPELLTRDRFYLSALWGGCIFYACINWSKTWIEQVHHDGWWTPRE